MTTAKGFAPAKINLTLHVTGQRPDGYHLLDSLVVFGDIGDRITVSPANTTHLRVTGPMGGAVPVDGANLVVRAAEMMGIAADIELDKHLPAAAGLGGGSSDAAATIRALCGMTGRPLPDLAALLGLGADVPLCMMDSATRMRGIGDRLDPVETPENLLMILVNPGVSVSTGPVFARLPCKDHPPMGDMPDAQNRSDWIAWLTHQRNDLEAPAIALAPVIANVLNALQASEGCHLARMSGSGATCFAIMGDEKSRDRAVERLSHEFPDWWIKPCNSGHPARQPA